jgi:Ala-tRNA(Pro) deacylase
MARHTPLHDPDAGGQDAARTLFMTIATPKSSDDLFAFLDSLGIAHRTEWHEPVYTVAESNALSAHMPGVHTKNLFLKDKKDQYFLLTVGEHATVDLKTIHGLIGAASRVSFGKPEKLMDYLGVIPGSVTTFGAINDTDQNVSIFLDEHVMAGEVVNCHPLRNDATTAISPADLLLFLKATGHTPHVLKLTV